VHGAKWGPAMAVGAFAPSAPGFAGRQCLCLIAWVNCLSHLADEFVRGLGASAIINIRAYVTRSFGTVSPSLIRY
jgi:hypothetical protein